MNLEEELQNYTCYDEQEEADCQLMLQYLKDFDDVFERTNLYGHFSSSPWIVNKEHDKVLMIYHNIYNSWGWCGGHSDGDQDLLHVAIKEGKEETGLKELKPILKDIFSLEVLPVPPHKKHGKFVSSHVHLNVTYLCEADETEILHSKPDENAGVRWIAIDEIDAYVSEDDLKPVYYKLIKKSKKYL